MDRHAESVLSASWPRLTSRKTLIAQIKRPTAAYRKPAGSIGKRLRRLLHLVIEAEKRNATRQIHAHLRTLSDRTLGDIGFSEETIATLRAGGEVDFPRVRLEATTGSEEGFHA